MAVSLQPENIAGHSHFGELPVGPHIARALSAMRYTTPTPIQERAIPPLREGIDVLGQAQTGTGKTAGFGIPLIESIDTDKRVVQAIVLVPTRELCLQVAAEIKQLGASAGVQVLPVYGGVGLGAQIQALARGTHVVVGTPGRVEDLLQRRALKLGHVTVAILDEADRMLDVGFLPAIERILHQTPASRQTALFSATIPEEIRGLANRQMRDPLTIAIDPERQTVDEIEQRFERVPDGDKLAALQAHLDDPSCFLALVFRRTTFKADRLGRDLSRRGYKVGVLHGRRTQGQRERVLGELRSAKLQVLVATDIAARGLDITGLTHVFNYDLPDTPDTYIHRIGRTGRAGESGTAITLIGPEDHDALRTLERYLAKQQGKDGQTPSRGSRNGQGRQQSRRAETPHQRPAPRAHSSGRPAAGDRQEQGRHPAPRRWNSRPPARRASQ